jgi:hypothetical protein
MNGLYFGDSRKRILIGQLHEASVNLLKQRIAGSQQKTLLDAEKHATHVLQVDRVAIRKEAAPLKSPGK